MGQKPRCWDSPWSKACSFSRHYTPHALAAPAFGTTRLLRAGCLGTRVASSTRFENGELRVETANPRIRNLLAPPIPIYGSTIQKICIPCTISVPEEELKASAPQRAQGRRRRERPRAVYWRKGHVPRITGRRLGRMPQSHHNPSRLSCPPRMLPDSDYGSGTRYRRAHHHR